MGAELYKSSIGQMGAQLAGELDYQSIERQLSHQILTTLKTAIPKNSVVMDLGPGCTKSIKAKTIPILKSLREPSAYAPFDASHRLVTGAEYHIQSLSLDVQTAGFKADIFNLPIWLKYLKKACLLVCGGMTISNLPTMPFENEFPEEALKQVLSSWRQCAGQYGWLMFSYMAPRSRFDEMQTYDIAEAHDWFRAFIQRMSKLPGVQLNFERFEPLVSVRELHTPHASERASVTELGLKSVEDLTVSIDGKDIFKPKDKVFTIMPSYRMNEDLLVRVAKEAGWRSSKLEAHRGINLQLFRAI